LIGSHGAAGFTLLVALGGSVRRSNRRILLQRVAGSSTRIYPSTRCSVRSWLTGQICACDACIVFLLESATGDLVLRASQVPHRASAPADAGGEGVTGWVAQHQSPVAAGLWKACEDPRFKSVRLGGGHLQAFLSVPIVTGGKAIGVTSAPGIHTNTAAEEIAPFR
jgi:GAF domain-containing protein